MADAIDMVELVRNLATRKRARACAVMTYDYSEESEWAAKLARKACAQHVDVLTLFVSEEQLAEGLAPFTPERLFSLLKDRAEKDVVVVSGMEFLKATWSGQPHASEEFARRMETWQAAPALCFVMQHDKAIAERPFRRFRQYKFVVDQKETIAL